MNMLVILIITWMDGSQTFAMPPNGLLCSDYMVRAIIEAHNSGLDYANMECFTTEIIVASSLPPNA